MKSIELKDDDKLYLFARKWGKMPYYRDGLDTCKLKSRIALGVLMWTLCKVSILLTCILVGAMLGDILAWAYVCLAHGYVEPDPLAKFTLALLAIVAAFAAVLFFIIQGGIWIDNYRDYKRRKRNEMKLVEPGILKQLYLSVKDKYCAKIEVKKTEIEPWD